MMRLLSVLILTLLANKGQGNYLRPLDRTRELQNETIRIKRISTLVLEYEEFKRINHNQVQSPETISEFLNSQTRMLVDIVSPLDFLQDFQADVKSNVYCAACNLYFAFVTNQLFSKEMVKVSLILVCYALTQFKTCQPFADNIIGEIDYIRKNTRLTAPEACANALGSYCFIGHSDKVFWTIDIPNKNTERYQGSDTWDRSSNTMKMVQIADIHYDKLYRPGSDADCDDPLCCRSGNADDTKASSRAGSWADDRFCDASIHVLDDALREISQRHDDAQLWLYLGDTVPHNTWNVTRNQVRRDVKLVTGRLAKYRRDDLKIYPLLGNHDTAAIGSFPPLDLEGYYNPRWLYDFVAKQWSSFLPQEAIDTMRRGGHYKVDLWDKVVLVVVNSNFCARLNVWTYYDSVDPGGQLYWMNEQLLLAEQRSSRVWLAMHIAPDRVECTDAWLYNYMRIVERYEHVIAGHFSGHQHWDRFQVVYSPSNRSRPVGVQLLTPAVTAYEETNPAYRTYEFGSEGNIINYSSYYANLTIANTIGPKRAWSLSYNAKKFFDVKQLDAVYFDNYVKTIESSDEKFNEFYKIYYSRSDKTDKKYSDNDKKAIIDTLRVQNPSEKNRLNLLPVSDDKTPILNAL
ncbi:Sphingomyelin phosphodiesterase [Halotydeus destructor]|nr:Sphingomyelin phosphodiesterase [Halotydeus destructor]